MRIFFSVGEPSGDLHGANLIRALQRRLPDAEFTGFGGPKMRDAGCSLLCDLTELAVMWVADVLKNIRRFRGLLREAERSFQDQRPDLVVLIDYPGFNWHVAKRAKALGIPVVYYGTPQLWAWAPWRVRKMRCFVDHALCKLPFEEKWFRDRGCNATFVGHPYFDELQSRRLDGQLVDRLKAESRPLVTLLPGSRDSEVRNNLPSLLRSAEVVARRVPETRFLVASFKEEQAQLARQMVEQHSVNAEVPLRPDARTDRGGNLLHGLFGFGLAGTALPRQAIGHPVQGFAVRLLRAELLPHGPLHYPGESADGRRPVDELSRGPLHPRRPPRRSCPDARVPHQQRSAPRKWPST